MDTMVLQFLRRMRPLFRNVNLTISCNSTKSLEANTIALDHVMPLITDGIKTCYIVNKQILYTIRDRFPGHFFAINQLQVLLREEDAASTIEFVELLLPWLCTRRDDGLPRMLKIPTFFGNALEFVERIRQVPILYNAILQLKTHRIFSSPPALSASLFDAGSLHPWTMSRNRQTGMPEPASK
jgi:hypothetical protein